MVLNRIRLVEASRVGGISFGNHEYSHDVGGSVHCGVEFFPMSPLNPDPVFTGKDLLVYCENGRLKCKLTVNCHKPDMLLKYFNPGCNHVKLIFDNRELGLEEFGFFQFDNVDLVDLEDPDYFDPDDHSKGFSFNIRFVMKGYQVPDMFIQCSDEMCNWFNSLEVKIWLYQKREVVKN